MKKLSVFAATLLLFMFCGRAQALCGISIYVNGQYLPLDSAPLLSEGTTFVPLRTVSSALCAEVDWKIGEAKITLGDKTISLKPGSKTATVNGRRVQLAAAPRVQEERVMVPLRFVSEQLAATVDYHNYTVDIHTAPGVLPPDIPKHFTGYRQVDDSPEYIYYAGVGADIWRVNKNTLQTEKLSPGADNPLNAAAAVKGAYRAQIYNGWLYYLDTPNYNGTLYRAPLAEGAPKAGSGGEPSLRQRIAGDVGDFWFVGDTLYYSSWGIKLFKAGLDGAGSEKLTIPAEAGYIAAHDAGWYYSLDSGDTRVLCRFRAGDTEKQKILDLRKFGCDWDIDKVAVLGNSIYFGTYKYVQAGGRRDLASGPVFRFNMNGGIEQLTEGKTLDFYVFKDILLYYDVSGSEAGWQVKRITA